MASSPPVRLLSSIVSVLLAAGCGGSESTEPADAGRDAGPPVRRDAGPPDSGACSTVPDAGPVVLTDGGPGAPPPELDCGEPSFPDGTGLRRRPYLQSTTRSSVRVAWTSTSGGDGLVRYAASPGGPWTEVAATAETFAVARTEDTEEYVAYDATLTGLEPNGAYCYEVVEDGETVASGLRLDTFWDGADRPIRLLAFGDSGNASADQMAVRDRFMEHEFDVFLHLGDMAYSDGTFVEFEERFFAPYADLLHRVPVYPTMGNHERSTDQGQPYIDVYYLPEVALRDEDQERYYSFDVGNVHFVSLDSNEATLLPVLLDNRGTVTDDLVDWLIDDLAASGADWKVAFFHHPPYSSSSRGLNWLVIDTLVPVLEAGGVDLVLVGHDHHYERSVPMHGNCAAPPGAGSTTYIIAGGGGAGLREASGDWFTAAVDSTIHSFLTLQIHGCTARGRTFDRNGDVIDAFELDGCE